MSEKAPQINQENPDWVDSPTGLPRSAEPDTRVENIDEAHDMAKTTHLSEEDRLRYGNHARELIDRIGIGELMTKEEKSSSDFDLFSQKQYSDNLAKMGDDELQRAMKIYDRDLQKYLEEHPDSSEYDFRRIGELGFKTPLEIVSEEEMQMFGTTTILDYVRSDLAKYYAKLLNLIKVQPQD